MYGPGRYALSSVLMSNQLRDLTYGDQINASLLGGVHEGRN